MGTTCIISLKWSPSPSWWQCAQGLQVGSTCTISLEELSTVHIELFQLVQLAWNDQQRLFFSRSQSPGMPAYMYSYIKQGRSVSSLRFHIVHNCYIVNQHLLLLFLSIWCPDISGAQSIPTTGRLPTLPCTSISPRTSPERFRWPAVWILSNLAIDDQNNVMHGDHNIDPHYFRCLAFRLEVSAERVWEPSWTTFKRSHRDPGWRFLPSWSQNNIAIQILSQYLDWKYTRCLKKSWFDSGKYWCW